MVNEKSILCGLHDDAFRFYLLSKHSRRFGDDPNRKPKPSLRRQTLSSISTRRSTAGLSERRSSECRTPFLLKPTGTHLSAVLKGNLAEIQEVKQEALFSQPLFVEAPSPDDDLIIEFDILSDLVLPLPQNGVF